MDQFCSAVVKLSSNPRQHLKFQRLGHTTTHNPTPNTHRTHTHTQLHFIFITLSFFSHHMASEYRGSGEFPRDTWTASTASSDGSSAPRTIAPLLPSSVLQSQDLWRQEPTTAPINLPWDWTFKSLWTATELASRKRKAPELNVPSTILFQSGDPTHWLSTDTKTGRLVRVGFPKPPKTSGGGKHASRELRLRAAWDGLLRFSEQMREEGVRPLMTKKKKRSPLHNRGGEKEKGEGKEKNGDSSKEPVVVAWYRDGGRENLDLETWSR